jgi:prefoldin subunit 5
MVLRDNIRKRNLLAEIESKNFDEAMNGLKKIKKYESTVRTIESKIKKLENEIESKDVELKEYEKFFETLENFTSKSRHNPFQVYG